MVAGVPVPSERDAELRTRISVMTQNPGLYTRLTVYDNSVAVFLSAIDLLGWRLVSRMFDRERLLTRYRAR